MKSGPVVQTKAGKLRGSIQTCATAGDYYAFKGIPYAEPPVGRLRFRDPQPAKPWKDMKDATKFGSKCAQVYRLILMETVEGSEDCLYLNVYSKSLEPNARRPVLFWIHGGHFFHGSGDDAAYPPDYFLRRDVVFVTINYRLGVFGFLNLDHEAAPGNQGLKDQVMALQWVRDNIVNFGGDPDNVTILGESAGSASVHYLTLSPLAKGLYHKAICQSGVVVNAWASLTEKPQRFAHRMCELLGKKLEDPKEIVEFLRTIDSKKLAQVQELLASDMEKIQYLKSFGPGVDDKSTNPFMPIHPAIAAEGGIQVPLLIGHTSREGIFFLKNMGDELSTFDTNFKDCIHPNALKIMRQYYGLGPEELRRCYFGKEQITSESREKVVDMLGDIHFVEGIHRVVKVQLERSCAPTYLYQFSYDKDLSLMKTLLNVDMRGASHGDMLPFFFRMKLFGTTEVPERKKGTAGYRLMEQMTEMWVNFATIGRPTPTTSELLPLYWQPVNNDSGFRYLNLDEDLRMEMTLNIKHRYSHYSVVKNKL